MSVTITSAFWNQGVLALSAALLAAAALWDARYFRIPNVFSLGLLVLFPAYVLTSAQPVVWAQHLIVAGLVLGLGFFLFARKLIGAGDAKLLGAASLWAGPERIGLLLLVMAVTGGILALVISGVAYLRRRKSTGSGLATVAKTPIPYGVAIATGGICTLIMMFAPLNPSLPS